VKKISPKTKKKNEESCSNTALSASKFIPKILPQNFETRLSEKNNLRNNPAPEH
jgi:hypothetical protein